MLCVTFDMIHADGHWRRVLCKVNPTAYVGRTADVAARDLIASACDVLQCKPCEINYVHAWKETSETVHR